MSSELVKSNGQKTKSELMVEFAVCENRIARTTDRMKEVDDENKALHDQIKREMAKQLAKLKANSKEKKVLHDQLNQLIGGRRTMRHVLQRLGVKVDDTKLERIMQDEDKGRYLQAVNS